MEVLLENRRSEGCWINGDAFLRPYGLCQSLVPVFFIYKKAPHCCRKAVGCGAVSESKNGQRTFQTFRGNKRTIVRGQQNYNKEIACRYSPHQQREVTFQQTPADAVKQKPDFMGLIERITLVLFKYDKCFCCTFSNLRVFNFDRRYSNNIVVNKPGRSGLSRSRSSKVCSQGACKAFISM